MGLESLKVPRDIPQQSLDGEALGQFLPRGVSKEQFLGFLNDPRTRFSAAQLVLGREIAEEDWAIRDILEGGLSLEETASLLLQERQIEEVAKKLFFENKPYAKKLLFENKP